MCSCLLLFGVLLLANGHKGLHVQGPSSAQWVQLGDTVVLPCFAQSPLPLDGLQVEWRKTGSEALVNVFKQGESRPELQSPSFRDRAHFFADEVSKGNFSIVLKTVGKKDAGVYRCRVIVHKQSTETDVEIKDIERLVVTGADRAAIASVGEDVILNCSVDSHLPIDKIEQVSWRRTDGDILVLLYQDNETFPESSHERYQGRVEFFTTEIPKGNFSLKLKDVKMEDKGEFICEVHSSDTSGHTIVVLQSLGLSVSHILMLVLCTTTLLLAAGFCVPVFIQLGKRRISLDTKVTSETIMRIHTPLILCPNICMCAAFILWSTEGFLTEVVTCSTISLIRPLLLIKAHPYLSRFPDCLEKIVKSLAVPVYHIILAIAVCSGVYDEVRQTGTEFGHIATLMMSLGAVIFIGAVILASFDFQMHAAMCLEAGNCALLCLVLRHHKEGFDTSFQIPTVLPSVGVGVLMVLVLQKYGFQGEPLKCLHTAVLTAMVVVFSMAGTVACIFFITTLGITFKVWIPLLAAVLHLITWIALILALCRFRCHKQASPYRGIGYLCCAIAAALLLIIYGALSLHYVNKYMENHKDCAGYMALTAMVHVLAATAFFKHANVLPYIPHMTVYMFGAVGLTIIDAVILATELYLKAGRGTRTAQDLRVMILPFEMIFVSGWLALDIYGAWMSTGNRIKQNFEDQRETEAQEMVALTDSGSNPPQRTSV